MYQKVEFLDFRNAFWTHGRGHKFSDKALNALYDYITLQEKLNKKEEELNVIEICHRYTEYDCIEDAKGLVDPKVLESDAVIKIPYSKIIIVDTQKK